MGGWQDYRRMVGYLPRSPHVLTRAVLECLLPRTQNEL